MSRMNRAAAVASTIVAALVINVAPASAAVLTSHGCINWSASSGCLVEQQCQVDTEAHTWFCYTIPHDNSIPTMEGGRF